MMSLRSVFHRLASVRRNARRGTKARNQRLSPRCLKVESLEGRAMLAGGPAIAGFALAAGSDSGVNLQSETYVDRITSVTTPTLTGTAPQTSVIDLYADMDGNGVLDTLVDKPLGQTTVPGNDPAADGAWTITSLYSLNDIDQGFGVDGQRTLFATATDASANVGDPSVLDIFVDTTGPQVASVTFTATGQDAFARVPSGPTQSISDIDITFVDYPVRTAGFAGYSALNNVEAHVVDNYQLVGQHGGTVPILAVNYLTLPPTAPNYGPGETQIRLTFANPLPDDTYTLTISDNLVDDAGNRLDGDVLADTTGGASTILLPSGDGTAGGTFSAQFGVLGGLCLAVQMTKGIQYTDLSAADPTNSAVAAPFYKASDAIFAGNFFDPSTGLADGFSKLAAYGMDGGHYRFLIKNGSTGAVTTVVPAVQVSGLPVAGDFDGVAANGQELGVFNGTKWYMFGFDGQLIKTVNWLKPNGLPIVGNFDGDQIPDLATWNGGIFNVALGSNNYTSIDVTVPFSFPGARERPVVADIDHDLIDDLGIWLPDSGVPSTSKPADWYFLPSGGQRLNTRTTAFTPIHYSYGSSVGVPVTGIFSPATLPGLAWPTSLLATSAPTRSVAAATVVSGGTALAAAAPAILNVNGTADGDVVQLAAGRLPDTWTLTVNGQSRTIPSSVTTLNLNGLAGFNSISIVGTGKSETAEIWPDRVIFKSGGLTISAVSFTTISVQGGGNDVARFHDGAGVNYFVARPGISQLWGGNYIAQAWNFASTSAIGTPTSFDQALLVEETDNATFNSGSNAVLSLADRGIASETTNFDWVLLLAKDLSVKKTLVATKPLVRPTRTLPTTTLAQAANGSTGLAPSLAALIALQTQTTKSGAVLAPPVIDAVWASYQR